MLNRWLFNTNKLKTNCKLGISRIKLLRNKKHIALKGFRREVADLLRAGKHGNARIRVESVIRETLLLQAFDTLEVYLELLAVRAELLSKTQEMPADMVEAISSVVYAAHRMSSDLPELAVLRSLLAGKYESVYKGWAAAAASDAHYREWQVNEGLVSCLSVEAPGPEQKIAVLQSICEEFEIPFDENAVRLEMGAPKFPAANFSGQTGRPAAAIQPSWGAARFEEVLRVSDKSTTDGQASSEKKDQGGWKPAALVEEDQAVQEEQSPSTSIVTNMTNNSEYQDAESALAAAARFRALAAAAEQSAARLQGDSSTTTGTGAVPPGGDEEDHLPPKDTPPGYVNRSESEIRRVYDAAPGYPVKPTLAGESPSAPPSTAETTPSDQPDTANGSAPTRPSGAPPSPDGAEPDELNELEELTRRFEALKRQ